MHFHYVLHGMASWVAVVSAFTPYIPPHPSAPEAGGVDGPDTVWEPLKIPRNAEAFQLPPEKSADPDSMKPLTDMHVKRIPPPNNGLHPQIRAVQHANAVSRRYRKRGIPGPVINEELAIRDVISSLEKSDLRKRQNNFDIVKSKDSGSRGSVAIDQDGLDYVYFSEIEFGSKNKSFYLVVDTGSSDTWVPSSDCVSQACGNHETYGKSDSDTLELEQKQFTIRYGTGSVRGVVAQDYLSFAGFRVNAKFGLAKALSQDFTDFPIDGIMGLGFPEISQMQVSTIIEVLAQEKLIDKAMFSVALSRARDQLNDGVIHFGRIDTSYYTGKMVFLDTIVDMGYWEIPMDDVGLDGTFFNFKNRTAIIDTGTSLLLLPPDDAYKVHYAIEDARSDGESFAVPCGTSHTIDIKIAGVTYEIPPQDWVGEPTTMEAKYCLSNIMSRMITNSSTTWLLGDVFLKNVYSTFDFDNRKIGFATRASPFSSTGTPGSSPTNSLPLQTAIVTVTAAPVPSAASGLTAKLCFILSGFFLGLVLNLY